MVNFHDPIVQAKEFGACVPQAFFPKSEGNWTHLPEALKWFWALVDGIFMWAWLLLAFCRFDVSFDSILTRTPSWEFMITLDYEWSVIRGRRPYRWTIWVCGLSLFFCPAKFQWVTI